MGRWLDARIEMLNDVRGEHLEVKEEMLLTSENVEVCFRAVYSVQKVGVDIGVSYFNGKDLFVCLLRM